MKKSIQLSKFSQKKSNDALKQAIENEVDYFKSFYIENNILYIRLDSSKLNKWDAAENPRLPYYYEIQNAAKRIYKKYRRDDIFKICYIFEYVTFNGRVNISPHYSDVKFIDCHTEYLNVYGGDLVEIIDSDNLGVNLQYCRIECEKLKLKNVKFGKSSKINISSNEITVENSILNSTNNIDISSMIMVFNDTKMKANNIGLHCCLIDAVNTNFKANYEFNIWCKYNEEVNGVDAEKIIYNNVDITNSPSIQRCKLLKKLILDFKELKDMVNNNIEKEVNEVTRIHKQKLSNKQILKILSNNNT